MKPGRRGVALLGATIVLVALLARSGPFERVEAFAYDARVGWLARARRAGAGWVRPDPSTRELVLVALDDRSVDRMKRRLPIGRAQVAAFLESVKRAGASVTALDYYLQGSADDPREDDALAAALKSNDRVICALRPVLAAGVPRVARTEPRFAALLLGQGSPRGYADADGLYRTGQLFAREPDGERLSLAMMAVAHHARVPMAELVRPGPGEPPELALTLTDAAGAKRRQRVPLTADGDVLLDLPAVQSMFEMVSLSDLPARLAAEPDLLRGKIVLMGDTHMGAGDFRPVATGAGASAMIPGVFLQAATIANVLAGTCRERASVGQELAILVLLGLGGAFAFVKLSERPGLVVLLVLVGLHALSCTYAFLAKGLWVSFTPVAALLAALYAETVWMRLAAERNARAQCEILLSSYFSPAAAAGLEPADDPKLAEKLLAVKDMLAPDGYEIVSRLGQGGMSVVFKAIQIPMKRTVALKFISPRLYQDAGARGRFVREAQLAARVLHPNLVAVFDAGESRGVPFIALEYIEGQSLKSLIDRRKALRPVEAAGILREILKGLGAVHAAGIVHRDIKSENVMISSDQRVKITDFGIARADTGDGFKTLQDIIMGTPAYLAPDIIVGDPPTPASDIYSLGIVLYEMLTGTVPYLGESAQAILLMHVNDPLPDPAARGVDVHRGLAALLRRMVEKKVADRPASCEEIQVELERLFPDAQAPAGLEAGNPSGKYSLLDVTGGAGGTVRTSRKTMAPHETSRITRG